MHSYTGDDEKKIGDLHEPMTEDSDNAVTEDFGDRTEDPDDKTEDSVRIMISVDLDADMSNEPELDFNEFGSDWFILL